MRSVGNLAKVDNRYSSSNFNSGAVGIYEPPPLPELDNKPMGNGKRSKAKRVFAEKFRAIFTLAFIFTGCLVFMIAFTSVTLKESRIKKLKDQLQELQDVNTNIRVSISEQLDLKYIEEVASTRLGMAKPESHQIRYVEVPKSSYSVSFDDVSLETRDASVGGFNIRSFLSGLFKKGR